MMNNSLTLINFITYCFFGVLSLYTTHVFFKMTLTFEKFNRKYIFLSYSIYFLVALYTYFFIAIPQINFSISLVGIILISFLYKSSIVSKFMYSLIFVIIRTVIEVLVVDIYAIATGIKLSEILENNNIVFFLLALANFIPFVLVKLYSVLGKNGFHKSENVPITVLLQLICVPVTSIIILYSIVKVMEQNLHYVSVSITLCIILLNIIFLNIYEKVKIDAENKVQMAILNSQIQYYHTLYHNLNNERKETLKLKHNFKNSLIGIKTAVVNKDTASAIKEVEKLLENNTYEYQVFSEIPLIDAILNYKNQYAKQNNIHIETDIALYDAINISDSDLANILGNALDNAIEACKRNIDKNKKSIHLQIEQRQDSVYIRISNPYENDILFKNNFPLSSKRLNEYGMGLKTIEKIVADKNNIMNIGVEGNIFELEIILFSAIK